MPRAIILVMDSCGIGASPDADRYGDNGADTFGHIVEYCAAGKADVQGLRAGPLQLPNLAKLGLFHAASAARGQPLLSATPVIDPNAAYGFATENSLGKDTPSGHWEMAGLPVLYEWGFFPDTNPCFPKDLTDALIKAANLPGILGNCHASGTQIIEDLGMEHIATQKPILYTSMDSNMQIAAHEQHFGLERLYQVCKIARKLIDPYNIGRIIARPFIGEKPGEFKRTPHRHDYATPPHDITLLDQVYAAGHAVYAIGKIADIFAHRSITKHLSGDDNMQLFDATLQAMRIAPDHSLIFSNFVDFDTLFGHRRNISGYAHALEQFDQRLPELLNLMQADDIAFITADHGCDPTFPGYNHTREYVPVLMFGPKVKPQALGKRTTFADIGQTAAAHLGVAALKYGSVMSS